MKKIRKVQINITEELIHSDSKMRVYSRKEISNFEVCFNGNKYQLKKLAAELLAKIYLFKHKNKIE